MSQPRKRSRKPAVVVEDAFPAGASSSTLTSNKKTKIAVSTFSGTSYRSGGVIVMEDGPGVDAPTVKGSRKPKNEVEEIEESQEPVEESNERNQGASVLMKQFMEVLDPLHDAILSREFSENIGAQCECGSLGAIYRCTGKEACFHPRLKCRECILKAHVDLPFHRLQMWASTHFTSCSLFSLGYRLRLGHSGLLCPRSSSTDSGVLFTVVHTNGFHELPVDYCHCINSDKQYIQLTKAGLFPSTLAAPKTAFTFTVLDDFHIHTLTSKKTVYDYHKALQDMTDPAMPSSAPNRYKDFNRVIRVWEHLANVRRAGQVHGIDNFFGKSRLPGSLCIRCPACPEIGVNVDLDTIIAAGEDESHKWTLYLSADGNFHLQRQRKRDDPDDVALKDGNAYCVQVGMFRVYIGRVKPCDAVSQCEHLRAVKLQKMVKFKNAVISGVVAIQCARHGLFLPGGMVDLTKGEAFHYTDYALAEVLRSNTEQRWLTFSYDIWCSYMINLRKRFSENFPKQLPLIEKMTGAIPSMHVHNHIEKCQYLHTFKYLKHSGTTHGEKIESSWSEANQTGGSTREMNDGRRHDTLDDFHNYFNWKQVLGLGAKLYSDYVKTLDRLKTQIINFDKFTHKLDVKLIRTWESVDDTPRMERKHKKDVLVSVHQPLVKSGIPTQLGNYEKQLRNERSRELKGDLATTGFAAFIKKGLRIEEDQEKVRRLVRNRIRSGKEDDALLETRVRLKRELDAWRKEQVALFPRLQHEGELDKTYDLSCPESAALHLPSSIGTRELCKKLGMEELVPVEHSLRHGQAYDALEDVRFAIRTFNVNLDFKKNSVHGQGPNTRAEDYLRTLKADQRAFAQTYTRARHAMQSLEKVWSMETDPDLEDLIDSDLWGKDTSRPPRIGETAKAEPWFWCVGGNRKGQESWTIDSDRVKWYRERSHRDRLIEEKEILEEELKRTVRYFGFMARTWLALAAEHVGKHSGKAAYAHKQAALYLRFQSAAESHELKAKEKGNVFTLWQKDYNKA